MAQLRQLSGDIADPLRRLLAKGVLRCEEHLTAPQAFVPVAAAYRATQEQQQAVDAVGSAFGTYAAFLLEGVTGSGKTEVYLQLAAAALAKGGAVMVLVPEIGLTPQLQQRFGERLGGVVTVLHSGMGDTERERAWHRVRRGLSRVVLGTRSLVLNPVSNLALIVVDEEHDTSFKQQEGFR